MNNHSLLYIETFEKECKLFANNEIALKQKAYMKNKFEFFGLKAPERKTLIKPFFLKDQLPSKNELPAIIEVLYSKPQREFHYFAQELAFKYVKNQEEKDILMFEYMIVNNSWWDTIDYIAPKLVSQYILNFPKKRNIIIDKWLNSNNIWLQRSAILYQLKYKDKMDYNFLTIIIQRLLGSNEFFINKAIGWILREISKTNSEWVLNFVSQNELSNLSKREAVRLINQP